MSPAPDEKTAQELGFSSWAELSRQLRQTAGEVRGTFETILEEVATHEHPFGEDLVQR